MLRIRWASFAVLSVACLTACSDPTQLVIVVNSDVDDVAEVTVDVLFADQVQGRRFQIGSDVSLPFSLTLTPSADPELTRRIEIKAFAQERAEGPLVTSVIATHFIPERRLALPVFLESDCEDVTCGLSETCERGTCVSAFVDPEDLDDFGSARDAGPADTGTDTLFDARDTDPDTSDADLDTGVDTGVVDSGGVDTGDAGCADGTVDLNGDPADGCECVIDDELCDGLDNDCDGSIDEGHDEDADTFTWCGIVCDGATCEPRADLRDCDDAESTVYPSADERCDALDNDCDGHIDEEASVPPGRCDDDDADLCDDGRFTCVAGEIACVDDGDDDVETCNAMDDDCDGAIDESACATCVSERHASGDYLFCADGLNWVDAAISCAVVGYRLVKVLSAPQNDYLVTRALELASGRWWIGLSDAETEGEFLWTDGDAVTFTAWGPGQPNNGGESRTNEDCVAIDQPISMGGWNDNSCRGDVFPFICEIPP